MIIDLDKSIKINLALAITVLTTVVTGAVYMTDQINDLRASLTAMQSSIDTKTSDRFTKTDAAEVALRNAILNPGTRFSDPRNPSQFIVVDSGRISTKTQ